MSSLSLTMRTPSTLLIWGELFHMRDIFPTFRGINPHQNVIFLRLFLITLVLAAAAAKSLQSCLTLCDPIDGSPPGSPVPGILQARTLEWVAISFSNAWKWKVKFLINGKLAYFGMVYFALLRLITDRTERRHRCIHNYSWKCNNSYLKQTDFECT